MDNIYCDLERIAISIAEIRRFRISCLAEIGHDGLRIELLYHKEAGKLESLWVLPEYAADLLLWIEDDLHGSILREIRRIEDRRGDERKPSTI